MAQEQSAIQIRIDPDHESARVLISEECDSASLSESLLAQYARDQGVRLTAEAEKCLEEIVRDYLDNPRAMEKIFIRTKSVAHGCDGHIRWQEGCDPSSGADPGPDGDSNGVANESGDAGGAGEAVDFYNQNTFINVKAGDHLGDVSEPEPGEDGIDVTGVVISAIAGKPLTTVFADGITIDSQGRLIAAIDGVLTLRKNALSISRLFEVPGCVDFNTGNIDFDGDVVVRDAVRDLFVIRATGSVTVQGLVEGATIVTGGDLNLRRGMAAREKGQIIVEGDADVGFLNLVRGQVRGDLVVRKEIIDSELVVGGNLIADHASIVGGDTIVTGSLNAAVLGSEAYAPTTITLGAVPLTGVKLMKLDRLGKELSRTLKRAEKKTATLGQKSGLEPEEQAELNRLREEIADLGERLKEFEPTRRNLQRELNTGSTVNAYVSDTIYARVNLRFVDRELQFRDTVKGPIKIGWDKNRNLVFQDAGGAINPISDITRVVNLAA